MAKLKASAERVRSFDPADAQSTPIPVDIWSLDPKSPEFAAEARRQSLEVANSPTEKEDQAFVDSVSWWPEDDD